MDSVVPLKQQRSPVKSSASAQLGTISVCRDKMKRLETRHLAPIPLQGTPVSKELKLKEDPFMSPGTKSHHSALGAKKSLPLLMGRAKSQKVFAEVRPMKRPEHLGNQKRDQAHVRKASSEMVKEKSVQPSISKNEKQDTQLGMNQCERKGDQQGTSHEKKEDNIVAKEEQPRSRSSHAGKSHDGLGLKAQDPRMNDATDLAAHNINNNEQKREQTEAWAKPDQKVRRSPSEVAASRRDEPTWLGLNRNDRRRDEPTESGTSRGRRDRLRQAHVPQVEVVDCKACCPFGTRTSRRAKAMW